MANPLIKILEDKRKQWRQDHPFGFVARPKKNTDGTLSLYVWECEMPGLPKSVWENGKFKLTITYYPNVRIVFTPPVFHPNVRADGYVCSSLNYLVQDISVKQLLFGLQYFLDNPNPDQAENFQAANIFLGSKEEYNRLVREDINKFHRKT